MYTHRIRNRGTLTHAVLAFVVSVLVLATVTIGATGGPLAPVNLEVVDATEDSITLAWGPTAPGNFFVLNVTQKGKGGSENITVGWDASTDTRSTITSYTVWKDGVIVGSPTTNGFVFTGVNKKTNSFRICVQSTTQSGLKSAQACGTISRL